MFLAVASLLIYHTPSHHFCGYLSCHPRARGVGFSKSERWRAAVQQMCLWVRIERNMHQHIPLSRDLVLIGGGHAHALVLRSFGMKPVAGVRLTLINPGPTASYSGMLPGHIAGHYPREALEMDLVRLARFAGARLVLAPAIGIERSKRRIQIAGQADIFYDFASVDVGITSELPDIPGFAAHAQGAKPLGQYADRWTRFVAQVLDHNRAPDMVVIGGGVAGVELALAQMHRLKSHGITRARLHIIEKGETALPGIGKGVRAALRSQMRAAGIILITGVEVFEIGANYIRLSDGQKLASEFTVAAATARPHDWLAHTGLTNPRGFIDVGPTLQSRVDARIYAVGDCADLHPSPRPKAGVFAVREAPILYHNLVADLTGGTHKDFHPQKSYLKLISMGDKLAIADKAGLNIGGQWFWPLLWRWKDRIDRKFMDAFRNFPAMSVPDLPARTAKGVREMREGLPLCGGCGAKISSPVLSAALSNLPAPMNENVLKSVGDDAALLLCGAQKQILSTDHLRAFMSDPYVMARIAANHALGDIWAMGAKPVAALASLTLPRMRPEMQAETLREIMMAAGEVFRAVGADVVGGHTAQGGEFNIGFTVTGLADGPLVSNSAAQAGDVLILTKPIGSGTILAAEMRGLAQGEWVAACYQHLQTLSDTAAAILAPSAHAMTDITGFGLAGHLQILLKDYKTGARLKLADIPLLDGAGALAKQGVVSSLWAANRAAVEIEGLAGQAEDMSEREILLFDPQTAGGLLASVPQDKAEACLESLAAAEVKAAVIGKVTKTPGLTFA